MLSVSLRVSEEQKRTYTFSRAMALPARACYSLVGGASLAGIGFALFTQEPQTSTFWALTIGCVGFLVLSVVGLRQMYRYRVSLFEDRLEYDSGFGFGVTVIRRDDIGGVRTHDHYGITTVRLFRKPDLKKLKTISTAFKADEAFFDWFEGLRDLDQEEAQKEMDEILGNAELGGDKEERLATAQKYSDAVDWFIRASCGVALWGMIFPRPYVVALLVNALIPAIAFLLLFKLPNIVQLETKQHSRETRLGLDMPILMPSAALGLRAVMDTRPIDWWDLTTPTVIGTLGICYLLYRAQAKTKWYTYALSAALLWPYPAGLVSLANQLLDSSTPERVSATVLEKEMTKDKTTFRYFRLTAGGPWPEEHRELVWRDIYESTEEGESVCLLVRKGTFNIPWWTIRKDCYGSSAVR